MSPSRTHVVIIPSYNAGRLLAETARQALAVWAPVWVVIDGSTDGSASALDALVAAGGLTVIDRRCNGGRVPRCSMRCSAPNDRDSATRW